jgi:hypothetical protein
MAEALSRYLPCDIERMTRSRGLFSKTVGLATRIRSARADLHHVFYVLQDSYLALKIGKKAAVGHACGSDIRDTLHSRWGWIVRHNLRNLDYVLSSQPTTVPQIREFTDKVEYFPIPIDRIIIIGMAVAREMAHVNLGASPYRPGTCSPAASSPNI